MTPVAYTRVYFPNALVFYETRTENGMRGSSVIPLFSLLVLLVLLLLIFYLTVAVVFVFLVNLTVAVIY